MTEREFLTEDDLDAMGVRKKRTLQKDRLFGRGFPYVKIRGSIRYRRSDIEAYLSKHTHEHGEPTARPAA